MEEQQDRNQEEQETVNPTMAAVGALTLVPGLNGAAWIALGHPIPVGLAWMAGMAAGCTLMALALCPKEEGRRKREEFARSAFIEATAGSLLSATTLVVMKIAQAL